MSQNGFLTRVEFADGSGYNVEIVPSEIRPPGTMPGRVVDVVQGHVQIRISDRDLAGSSCVEPDRFAEAIVDAVLTVARRPFESVSQHKKLVAEVHAWLCKRRSDAPDV